MDIIKERNNSELGLLIVVIIAVMATAIGYFWNDPIPFYSCCIITVLLCFFLYFRRIEVHVKKNQLKIRLLLLFIPYKTFNVHFDNAKLSQPDTLTFYKNQSEILTLTYQDDVQESSYEFGWLEIKRGTKFFEFGNRTNSFGLFKKIAESLSKYNTLADK